MPEHVMVHPDLLLPVLTATVRMNVITKLHTMNFIDALNRTHSTTTRMAMMMHNSMSVKPLNVRFSAVSGLCGRLSSRLNALSACSVGSSSSASFDGQNQQKATIRPRPMIVAIISFHDSMGR